VCVCRWTKLDASGASAVPDYIDVTHGM